MACYPLSEDTFTVDASKVFVPFLRNVDDVRDRPGSLLVDICPFLLNIGNERIMIDPGLGLKNNDNEYQVIANLRKHNLAANDITLVLLSHLHKDHIGGCFVENDAGLALMFPKATHYVQQGELEYAMGKSSKSYEQDKIQFLLDSNRLTLLQGNGSVDTNIHYEVSGGHTPYHQVFFIEDTTGGRYFFGGDVVPQVKQFQIKFVAKYDHDGVRAAELRLDYAERMLQEQRVGLFFHSTLVPMARLRRDGDKVAFDRA